MAQSNLRLGIILMIATTFVFAMQDGISRHLAGEYNVFMVVMIRYWFFAAFVIFWAKANIGSIRKAAQTKQQLLQSLRGIILAVEICIMVLGFVFIGLIESLAIFTIYPLIIAALSGPILGETVGWRRSIAICVGFIGIIIILQPGLAVFSIYAIFPLCSAILFALYGLLTRYAARQDSAETSFFLDWRCWFNCYNTNRYLFLGTNAYSGLVLDGVIMRYRCIWALSAHKML